MAVQLQLTRKADGKVADLVALDNEICDVLGVEPHPRDFYVGWVDTIGFSLACGKTFEEVRSHWCDPNEYGEPTERDLERGRVIDYLETYFDNTSYGCR